MRIKSRVTAADLRFQGLLNEALGGNPVAQAVLKAEAFSTSDFPALFQKAVNVSLDTAYTEAPAPQWPLFSRRHVVSSLSPEKFRTFAGSLDNLPTEGGGYKRNPASLPHVPELTEYPAISYSGGEREVGAGKFGARTAFSWEAWLHDDWNLIESLPGFLGLAAVRTEDTETYSQLLDANGWNAANFNYTDDFVPNNPALTLEGLGQALAHARRPRPEDDGSTGLRVNTITKWILAVAPELETLANSLLAVQQVKVTDSTGTEFLTGNPVSGSISSVMPLTWMPLMSPNSTYKSTAWALLPAGGNGSDRPTFVTTFLRGYETPEFRIKDDTGRALGGGTLDAYAGSFDVDDIQTRCRHFTGAGLVDKLGISLSKGDDSQP